VVTTKTDEDGDVGEVSRMLVEVFAEVGFQRVASMVSTDDDAAKVVVTMNAGQARKLVSLIARGRQ
jgi:hypothetical protein